VLEGRANTGGLVVVGLAVVALVAFAGLLYLRGSTGPRTSLSGSAASARPSAPASGSPPASGSSSTVGPSARPAASRVSASPSAPVAPSPTAVVAGVTSRPSAAPSRTPAAAATPRSSASATETATGAYRLPNSPQAATVALGLGQGDCSNAPAGGVLVETSFTASGAGRLSALSPSRHRLSGQLRDDGSFILTGANPVERWVGTLTATGGTGSFLVTGNGCTEGYETTIAFHP
jgi:hypothetical protein